MKSFFILISRFATPPRCVCAGPGLMLVHQKKNKKKKRKKKQKIVIKVGDLSLLSPSRNPNPVMVSAQLRTAPASTLPHTLTLLPPSPPARQLLCFPCVFRGILRIFSSNFITIFTWHICSHFDLAKGNKQQ